MQKKLFAIDFIGSVAHNGKMLLVSIIEIRRLILILGKVRLSKG